MAGQDKTVKITIGIDEASAAKAKAAIAEITKQVKDLVKATEGLGPLLGMGGGGGSRVSSIAGAPGTSSATQMTHGAAGGAKPQGILGVVTAPAQAISNVAAGAQKSVKTLKDGFKDLADAGEREARRLERSFGKFASLYTAANAQVASARLAGLQAAGAADVERMRGKGGGAGAPPGGGTPGAGGMPGWMKGLIGGVSLGTAAWATEKAIVGGYFQNQFAQTGYNLAQPFFTSGAQAQAGDIFGQTAVGIRKGDVARAWAIYTLSDKNNKAKAARDYQHIISADYKKDILQKITQDTPVTLKENIAANAARGGTGLGGIWSTIVDRTGATVANFGKMVSGAGAKLAMRLGAKGPEVEAAANFKPMTAQMMARAQEESRSVTRQAEAAQQAAEQYMRAHPQFVSDINEFYAGALGDTGLARAARLGGGFYKNPRTGAHGDSVSDYIARATEMGISGGERAAMAHRLAGAAGWGMFGHGDALLSPEAGGLGSAAGILGLGSQFGGGGWKSASGFLRGFQGQIGRGGLDVMAANQVAQLMSGSMMGGNFGGGTGTGLRDALLEAASGGTPGWDMRGARTLGGGLQAMSRVIGGGGSGLDQALNWSAALNVPGVSYAGASRLSSMDPATLLDIMRGGGVNPVLAKMGVNQKTVTKMMQNRGASWFSGTINDLSMITPDMRKAFESFQRSGGNTHFMRGMKADQRADTEASLAAVAAARDRSLTPESALAEIKLLEGAWGDLPGLSGKGARDSVSTKTPRATALKMQAKFKREYGQRLQEGEDKQQAVTGALKAMGITADQAEAAGIDVSGAVENSGINGTIDQLDKILRKFVSQLHGEVGGHGAGPPGG